MPDNDVIIIGSGPAGVMAALPLVEGDRRVTMIDGGHDAPPILREPMEMNFEDIRRTREDQARWFLGEDLSNIPLGGLQGGHGGGMAGGNRAYATADTDRLLPVQTGNAHIIQSLARGGLGAVWGGTCAYMNDAELTSMGLPVDEMNRHYALVSQKIGISGPGEKPYVQPPLTPDHHAHALLNTFNKKRSVFDRLKMHVEQPYSAVLTKDLDDRKATTYADMDYYADPGRSLYRPQYTLEELMTRENFCYEGGYMVERVIESDNQVTVEARELKTGTTRTFTGSTVILAAGAINSARILLRSFDLYGTGLPFIAKPHAFVACLHTRMLGKAGPKERISTCQLLLTEEGQTRGACAQLYSYRSLLLVRLLNTLPLPIPEAFSLLALLSPALVIADIRFPTKAGGNGTLTLQREGLVITIPESAADKTARHKILRRMKRAMRHLGLLAVKTALLPEGSSSHYAGTIPCTTESLPLSTDAHGALRQAKRIYVADASVFRSLPSLPHTLTIMANAHRIGAHVFSRF